MFLLEFDTAELQRVYGKLKPIDTAMDTANAPSMNGHAPLLPPRK